MNEQTTAKLVRINMKMKTQTENIIQEMIVENK